MSVNLPRERLVVWVMTNLREDDPARLRRCRRSLLALLGRHERELLDAAAERAVVAALANSAGAHSTSSDFEYAIRCAVRGRP